MPKFFHLSYPAPPRPDRTWRIHELRDDASLVEIMPLLCGAGFHWGGKILSIRPPGVNDLEPDPSDLVVLTTRPPLSGDLEGHDSKRNEPLRPGGGSLESCVFVRIRRYLRECHRTGVALQDAIATRLVRRDYSTMQFYVNRTTEWACLKRVGVHALDSELHATIGFVLRIPPGDRCPGVLCLFGMNGPASLLFAHLVASRLPQLLDGPGLSMVEIHTEPIPPSPSSLSFVERLRYEVLLDRQALPEDG